MDLAREGARRGDDHGTVFGADHQTHGRGRFADRHWITPAGTALTFTLLLRTPPPTFPISLRAGLGVCRWLEGLGLRPVLKWPNDVLLGGRKLCGILVESAPDYTLVGIGVNVTAAPPESVVRTPATCLAEHLATVNAPRSYVPTLLRELDAAFLEEEARTAVNERLAWRGQTVLVQEGAAVAWEERELLEVDERGYLLTRCGESIRTLVSGEVRTRV